MNAFEQWIGLQIFKKFLKNREVGNVIKKVFGILDGHKTWIAAALGGASIVANLFGVIDDATMQKLCELAGFGTIGFGAVKVNKLIRAVGETSAPVETTAVVK